MQKVYLDENNAITVSCPRCSKSRTIDATPFLQSQGTVKLAYRFKCTYCDCGHKECSDCKVSNCTNGNSNIIAIERRKFFRKKVDLTGSLVGEKGRRHPIRVLDLSRTGLRAKIMTNHNFQVDQLVQVEFALDDARETTVQKHIVIRQIDGKMVDAQFSNTASDARFDKTIGFYLMK